MSNLGILKALIKQLHWQLSMKHFWDLELRKPFPDEKKVHDVSETFKNSEVPEKDSATIILEVMTKKC